MCDLRLSLQAPTSKLRCDLKMGNGTRIRLLGQLKFGNFCEVHTIKIKYLRE
jgi:hypothetical protein